VPLRPAWGATRAGATIVVGGQTPPLRAFGSIALWASVVVSVVEGAGGVSSSATIGLLIDDAKAITFLPGSKGSLL